MFSIYQITQNRISDIINILHNGKYSKFYNCQSKNNITKSLEKKFKKTCNDLLIKL